MNGNGASSSPEPSSSSAPETPGPSSTDLQRAVLSSVQLLTEQARSLLNISSSTPSSGHASTSALIPKVSNLVVGLIMARSVLQNAEHLAEQFLEDLKALEQEQLNAEMRRLGLEPAALDPLTPSSPSVPRNDI